jgi:hypothetical protein
MATETVDVTSDLFCKNGGMDRIDRLKIAIDSRLSACMDVRSHSSNEITSVMSDTLIMADTAMQTKALGRSLRLK